MANAAGDVSLAARGGADVRSADPGSTDGEIDPHKQPGAEWEGPDGTRYRRAKNGLLQRWVIHQPDGTPLKSGRWLMTHDPDRVLSPNTKTRYARQQRHAASERPQPPQPPMAGIAAHGHARSIAGFAATDEDKLRIKLRTRMRKVQNPTAHAELPTLPGVHALSHSIRYLDGGRLRFIELIQHAVLERQPAAEAFYAVFADLTVYERQFASFDDVCCAAGIRPSELISQVISVQMEHSRDVGNLVAAMLHPEVIEKMAKSAVRIEGPYAELAHRDRLAFLQGRGFLPAPKGATIVNVHASANVAASASASTEPSVPSFAQDLDLTPTTPAPLQLSTADPALAPIDVTPQPVYVSPSDDSRGD